MSASEASAIIIATASLIASIGGLVAAFKHQGDIGQVKAQVNGVQHENANLRQALGMKEGEMVGRDFRPPPRAADAAPGAGGPVA